MFYYYLRNTAALFKEWKRSAAPDTLNIFSSQTMIILNRRDE